MKAQNIITLFFAFVVTFSVDAQGEKKSFRIDRNYGIGLNPVFNVSSTGQGNSKTNQINLGVMATGTLNLRKNLVTTIGVGILSGSEKYSFGVSSFGANRNSLVIQLGVFVPVLLLEINDQSQIDFSIGLTGIYSNGKEIITNEFGPDLEVDVNSLLFAPAARAEWFIRKHLTVHTQLGIGISYQSENINGFSNTYVNLKPIQTDNLLGQFGFSFYF